MSGKEGNADWRDGIIINTGNGEGKIAGLFTIGEKASVGAVAGETINGALIRNCIVTGPYRENNIPMNGRIKGSVRSGGIVGMNNRGSKIEGCEVLVEIDAENYEVNYQFDATGTGFDIYKAVIAQVDAVIVSVEGFIDLIQNPDPKRWRNNLKLGTTGLDSILMLVNGPVGTYLKGRYRNVCIGGIVGENYGTIGFGCISYTQSVIRKGALFKGWTMHHGVTIGRNNFYSSAQNIKTAEYQKPQQASAYSQSSPFMLYSSETTSGTLASAGSVTDPVIIRTEDDLKELMQAIRETGLRDTYVKQVKDIVLADNSEFKGFRGTFKGVYDGSGCTISGIASDKPLFENLDGAEIKNLGVKNSIFSAGAAIAGNVKDSIIQNCWIEETVSIGSLELSFAAGFADILEDSPIYNVYNYAQMQATTAVCGIVREMKGSSCIASCLVDIQKIRSECRDYALALIVGKDSILKNCLWMSSSASAMAAADKRSTEEKNKGNGCCALTNNAEATGFAFELANRMDEEAEEAQTLLIAALEEAMFPFESG